MKFVAMCFKKSARVIADRYKKSTENVAADASYSYQCPFKGLINFSHWVMARNL